MTDIKNAKWDLSKGEQCAIKWFEENGFDLVLEKQFVSKTVFLVSKDGMSDTFELSQHITKMEDVQRRLDVYMENFAIKVELERLRKEVDQRLKKLKESE